MNNHDVRQRRYRQLDGNDSTRFYDWCLLTLIVIVFVAVLSTVPGCGTDDCILRDGVCAEDIDIPPQGRPGYRKQGGE